MKKTLILGMALGLALTATAAMAASGDGGTGIIGTDHDLSSATYGDAQSRICVFCHHPHNAVVDANLTYNPLWNHAVTTNAGSFTAYNNGIAPPSTGRHALNATLGQPGGVSLLCLSCHDGSVALNAYSAISNDPTSGAGDQTLTAASSAIIGVGGDLSNHHPIGFDYAAVSAADPEIEVKEANWVENGTTGAGPTGNIGLTIEDTLYGGKFECVSCHDVHNTQNTGEKFLWVSNDSSLFCMTCHLKDGTSQQ